MQTVNYKAQNRLTIMIEQLFNLFIKVIKDLFTSFCNRTLVTWKDELQRKTERKKMK